jgi:hypothetical protein
VNLLIDLAALNIALFAANIFWALFNRWHLNKNRAATQLIDRAAIEQKEHAERLRVLIERNGEIIKQNVEASEQNMKLASQLREWAVLMMTN